MYTDRSKMTLPGRRFAIAIASMLRSMTEPKSALNSCTSTSVKELMSPATVMTPAGTCMYIYAFTHVYIPVFEDREFVSGTCMHVACACDLVEGVFVFVPRVCTGTCAK